tara:strand:+ start:901 stop:1251 length:351 start_codon:yes stop_codon:yes gene_type:complete
MVKKEWTRTKLGWEETYKEFSRETAQYPKEREMDYLMIGLANEVGELLGKYKKMIRGDENKQSYDGWIGEMGDIMWYLIRLCDVLDLTLYEVMETNVAKLTKRLAEDTIMGDGDDR